MEREPAQTHLPGVVWTLAWGYPGITPWEAGETLLALRIKVMYYNKYYMNISPVKSNHIIATPHP